MAKYYRNNVWTIDCVNEVFKTLADAKHYIGLLTSNDWKGLMNDCEGICYINHWMKDDIVSRVVVQGKHFFTKPIKC